MPDTFSIINTCWQKLIQPSYHRVSFRVTKRGVWALLAWFLVVFLYSLANVFQIYPLVGRWFSVVVWLLAGLAIVATVIIWLAIVVDYVQLLKATSNREDSLINGLQIERQVNHNLSVQTWSNITLILRHYQPKPEHIFINIMDNYPIMADVKNLPLVVLAGEVSVQPTDIGEYQDGCQVVYELLPKQRGMMNFSGVDLLLTTRFGLLSKFAKIDEKNILGTNQVRVLANFVDVIEGQLLAVSQKSAIAGLLKQRRKGQGQDFHQIRNYNEGDSIRHLDWKATSRYQRLMTKEFQDEKDQQIMFLLDCGQHMRHNRFFDTALAFDHDKVSESNHLDQALNAMLLLAEIANQQGDATGFINFASENDKIIPPKKGQQVMSYLLNQSFDIQSSMLLPDYMAVARTLRNMQKKRSLVILITNTRQEEHSELIEAIQLLSAKHLVLLANLYEQDLQQFLENIPNDADQAMTYHTVQEYFTVRQRLHQQLQEQTGVYTLNCTPNELPNQLIQSYFAIKHKNHL